MIELYFGKPGSGKTTMMVALMQRDLKKGRKVYCNTHTTLSGVIFVENAWIGVYDISDGILYIDEAAVFANSRNSKNFPHHLMKFINYHRHYGLTIRLFCQRYNAVDLNIRALVDRLYRVRRGWFGRSIAERIQYALVIPDAGDRAGEIVEGYRLSSWIEKLLDIMLHNRVVIWRPKYYKYFDSYERPYLPPLPSQP